MNNDQELKVPFKQYTTVPKQLMWVLDNDLKAVLMALIDERMAPKREDIFFVPQEELKFKAGLCRTKLIACLDTLYEQGLIAIKCEGQAKGESQACNSYRLNYEAINAYCDMSFQDLKNPSLLITSKRTNRKEETLYLKNDNPFPLFYRKPQNVDTIEELQELQEKQDLQDLQEKQIPTTISKPKEEEGEYYKDSVSSKLDIRKGQETPNDKEGEGDNDDYLNFNTMKIQTIDDVLKRYIKSLIGADGSTISFNYGKMRDFVENLKAEGDVSEELISLLRFAVIHYALTAVEQGKVNLKSSSSDWNSVAVAKGFELSRAIQQCQRDNRPSTEQLEALCQLALDEHSLATQLLLFGLFFQWNNAMNEESEKRLKVLLTPKEEIVVFADAVFVD